MPGVRVLSLSALLSLASIAACANNTSAISSDKNAATAKGGGASNGTLGASSVTPGAAAAAAGACVKDPSFYDVPGDGCDNDGDGTIDNPPTCDSDASSSPEDFAHTLGICDDASTKGYGLVSVAFTRGFEDDQQGNAGQHGSLPKFGDIIKPREGARLGVLSTGFAQEFNGNGRRPFVDGKEWGTGGSVPPGFPKAAGNCPQATDVHDVISVKLELQAPKNAKGFKFDFDFHSSEWPDFICSDFNDGFIAFLTAKGFNNGTPDNISFDAKNDPVSVNNGFFDRCTPSTVTNNGMSTCPGGPDELNGTGFGPDDFLGTTQGGATGWLSSKAAVQPGETFTLSLMIWDTGDGDLDSSVLLDNFQWIGAEVAAPTTERPTDVK